MSSALLLFFQGLSTGAFENNRLCGKSDELFVGHFIHQFTDEFDRFVRADAAVVESDRVPSFISAFELKHLNCPFPRFAPRSITVNGTWLLSYLECL